MRTDFSPTTPRCVAVTALSFSQELLADDFGRSFAESEHSKPCVRPSASVEGAEFSTNGFSIKVSLTFDPVQAGQYYSFRKRIPASIMVLAKSFPIKQTWLWRGWFVGSSIQVTFIKKDSPLLEGQHVLLCRTTSASVRGMSGKISGAYLGPFSYVSLCSSRRVFP